MEDKNKKVTDIKDNIKSLENDLLRLQEECPHPHTTIKFDVPSHAVRKICRECQKIIGYPTEEELKDNDFL